MAKHRLPIKELQGWEHADGDMAQKVLACLKPLADKPDALAAEFETLQLRDLSDSMCRLVKQFVAKDDKGGYKFGAAEKVTWWADYGSAEFPELSRAAIRLLSMHATSCASERNWSLWGSVYTKARNRLSISRAEKLIFIRGNSDVCSHSDDNIMLSLLGDDNETEKSDGPAEKRQRVV